MKRLLSLMLLLFCSLTFCGVFCYAQTWCVSSSAGGSKPKIAVDNDGVSRIVWLQANPSPGGANDVYYARYDTATGTWSSYNLTNDAFNQHCCAIAYNRMINCRWIAYDMPKQIRLSYYYYPDSVSYYIPTFDTLLPVDTSFNRAMGDNQYLSQIIFASGDTSRMVIGWSSDSAVHNQKADIYYKEITDTVLGPSVLVPLEGFDINYYQSAYYIQAGSYFNGKPLFSARGEWFENGMIAYGYYRSYIYWNADSIKWLETSFAGYSYHMGWIFLGSPSVGMGLANDAVGNSLVFFANTASDTCDTILCIKYNAYSGNPDTSYIIASNTPVHSGSCISKPRPTLAWSNRNNIYLQAFYDSIWSHPPKQVNPVSIDSCINPAIDFDRDSIVWVSYESHGQIYVTRTSIPLGITEKPVNVAGRSRIGLRLWPNPTNNFVHFSCSLPEKKGASLSLYDIAGRLVKTLDISDNQINWDCADHVGRKVASGVYFARLRSGGQETIKRISIIK